MALFSEQGGAAVVEFALLAPVLLLILAGTIDYGRYLVQSMQVAGAVRAAVQQGIDAPELDLAAVKKRATDQLASIPGAAVAEPVTEEKCPEGSPLNKGTCTGYGKPQLYLTVAADAPFDATFLPTLKSVSRQATGRLR